MVRRSVSPLALGCAGRAFTIALPVALAIALAGCAGMKSRSIDRQTTSSISPMNETDVEAAVSAWGQRYATDPKNKDIALNYAAALLRTGRTDQAVAVLQKTAIHNATDQTVLAAYGKALAANGSFDQALQIIRRAQTPDRPDWRLLSAEAAILDQVGQSNAARKLYLQALDFAPNEPTVLSNLGMSYLVTGDLVEAEKNLRKAAAAPRADSRVRQNLALVVGLQGRFDEAEKIAAADLSPDEAAANIAYLRNMLSQTNNWKNLKTATEKPEKPPADRG